MARFLTSAILFGLAAHSVYAQTTCGSGTLCPEDSPCCSQYGQCGTGAYCLGGCDPQNSFSLNSCVPAPACQNKTLSFRNSDNLMENTKYLGDASQADFVYSGQPIVYRDQVLLTMTEGSVGTLLASTSYMWYGKATARARSSGGQGVVTAFIILSDVKDEIDFEWVGYNLSQVQTNYYFQGILDYDNGGNSSVNGGNAMTDYHDYELDWTPDQITWSVDGNVVRTLEKSTTWNSTANRYDYPQSPGRVQLSIWPAGSPSNGAGTIAWAGGEIDWNSTYMTNGYYYAAVSDLSIECYNPPSGANTTGHKSYVYTSNTGLNNSVSITDDNTILSSFEATGLNETAGATASASGSRSSATAGTVPGQSNSGTGSNGQRGSDSDSGSSSSSSSASGSAATGFVQGGGGGGGSSSAASGPIIGNDIVVKGSILTVVVTLVGMLVL